MTDAARWQRIRALFDELVELAPERRGARLAEIEAEDVALVEEVAALLAADGEAGLEMPASLTVESAPDGALGRRFGNWIPTELLGAGGMGRVYLARRADRAFEKTAALKVLRGGVDGVAFRERFASERRIVAALEHPGIARLLDGGETDDGVPFLVLEHVAGVDVVSWCERRRLCVASRLRLFRGVLDAVAYAHRHLVVHRDLKPSNILVSEDGEPKLLDFGIAKLLDGSERAAPTVTAERMLTPEYASPEQIRGEPVTVASDVYSLGVLLFELLVGRTPFRDRATSPGALARAIEEVPPPAPSSALGSPPSHGWPIRAGELRGDLDAVVLKALRKEPDARYRSVEAFADDLDALLSGRPVAARRDSLGYRAAKFARRHRWALAAALATLIAFAATITIYTLRLRAERDLAERRFSETREIARALIFDIHDAIRDLDGATAARRLLLERALGYLDRLRSESDGDPDLAREVAEGYLRVAEILSDRRAAAGLEMSEQVAPLLEAASALVARAPSGGGTLDDRRLLVRILGAQARRRFGGELDPETRLAAAHRAVELAEAIVGETPGRPGDARSLARALRDEADLLGFAGRVAEAATPVTQALAVSRRALALAPEDRELMLDLADSELAFARVTYRLGLADDALPALARAIEILEPLAAEAPESVEVRDRLATALATSGSHAWQNGEPTTGVERLARAEALHAATVASDSSNEQARRRLSTTRTELAVALVAAGRYDEAMANYRDALDSLRRASERPGAPAFLVYERAFLSFHLATAARIAAAGAPDETARDRCLARARAWYAESLRLQREGEAAGISSHLEPETWERVRREAAELGVS